MRGISPYKSLAVYPGPRAMPLAANIRAAEQEIEDMYIIAILGLISGNKKYEIHGHGIQ